MKIVKQIAAYTGVLVIGIVTGASMSFAVAESSPPAYVIVSGTVLDPDGMGPYGEKAGPLARAAGIQIKARGEVQVLEGEWNHPKVVTIEQFDSMAALKSFWYSDGYQEAIKLRDGKFKADFIVAVEAN
jgi:uncharacterized protein (DUF1330 family)